ncbi:MAG TPA: insulinase family protein [Candidatus Hydrogenedentes bacterium]|nr:insulinase family protein [Candidatus Hydrogenedentota bacterium]
MTNVYLFHKKQHRIARVFALCVLFGQAALAGYTPIGGPYPDDPLQAHIYRLDNGLEVYLSVNRDTPRFYAEIAVRAGSKHDPPETTGLAHYMEHLLFKGSTRLGTLDYTREKPLLDRIAALYERHFEETDPEKRRAIYEEITRASTEAAVYAAPNELDRVYRAMGGRGLNAHTWHEEVVYKIDLPINCLEHWAVIESDRFARPVFRLFQTELETVYEEMNRALDNKDRIIQYAVNAALFKKHPYGQQPTLGHVEHLKNPSIKRLLDFYDKWYGANNMAIFISGDIDLEKTMEIIDRHFSAWSPVELPEPPEWEEDPLNGREEVRVRYEAEPFVLLAFRTAPRGHPDAEPLAMLDMILSNSVAGLIDLNLNQRQRARDAGSFPMMMNDYGAQYLYGVPKDGQTLEEVEALLLEQLALIRNGEFADWLIPAIINEYRKREKTALESDANRASMMRRAWIGFEPWERAHRVIERMATVTRDDVIRVANAYFGGSYIAGLREDAPHDPPKVEKPPLPDITIDPTLQSVFAEEVLAMPMEPIEPVFLEAGEHYQRREEDDGAVFYHADNPLNDVFGLSIVVDFGVRQDNRMAIAARLFQRTGTERLSAEELKIAWYRLGTDFSINVSDNETSLSLSGLDSEFDASVSLLMEMLTQPKTDDATLEELKNIILAQRADARKDPQQISSALVEYNRSGAASAYLTMLPSPAVRALTAGELQELLRRAFSHPWRVLYTGTLPLDAVAETAKEYHIAEETLTPPPYYAQPVRRVESNEIYFLNREMAQTHIRLEFGSVPYSPEISAAAQLYNMYFAGGMAGIVFQELREKRALAYVVGARYVPGARRADANIMLGVIQTQADKTIEAVAAFSDLMDNLPLSAERYAFARNATLNDYRANRVGFRAVPGVILDWDRRGLEPDPRRRWYKEIMGAEDMSFLADFHQNYIADNAKLVSIVGEEARVDMAALETLGSVRTITVDEVFVE